MGKEYVRAMVAFLTNDSLLESVAAWSSPRRAFSAGRIQGGLTERQRLSERLAARRRGTCSQVLALNGPLDAAIELPGGRRPRAPSRRSALSRPVADLPGRCLRRVSGSRASRVIALSFGPAWPYASPELLGLGPTGSPRLSGSSRAPSSRRYRTRRGGVIRARWSDRRGQRVRPDGLACRPFCRAGRWDGAGMRWTVRSDRGKGAANGLLPSCCHRGRVEVGTTEPLQVGQPLAEIDR